MDNPFEDIIERLDRIESLMKELAKEKSELIEGQLLSPAETCNLFNPRISKPTLHAWTKAGRLQKYQLGARVFYKRNEVMESISLNKTDKYERHNKIPLSQT